MAAQPIPRIYSIRDGAVVPADNRARKVEISKLRIPFLDIFFTLLKVGIALALLVFPLSIVFAFTYGFIRAILIP